MPAPEMKLQRSGKVLRHRRLIESPDIEKGLSAEDHIGAAAKHGVACALAFTDVFVKDRLLESRGPGNPVGFEVCVVLRGLDEGQPGHLFHPGDQGFNETGKWILVGIEDNDVLVPRR